MWLILSHPNISTPSKYPPKNFQFFKMASWVAIMLSSLLYDYSISPYNRCSRAPNWLLYIFHFSSSSLLSFHQPCDKMNFELLPQDCISHILSCTSPRDACRSELVSTTVRHAGDSDSVWEKFLPSDYQEILSRLVSPLVFASKKELYSKLCRPLLIDEGRKVITILW